MIVTRNALKSNNKLTVTAAAKALGVSRTHLSLVLHGHRKSRSLRGRYLQLQRSRR